MIYVYVGKPRNGKSLRAMMRILWTLQHTRRFIVTNMVIDMDAVQDWCDARNLGIHARSRFLILETKEQMRNFWLYRDGHVLERPADYDEPKGKGDVDYAPLFAQERFWDKTAAGDIPTLKGTLYVIDEVHTLFPARGWQGTPRHADFYNSQHGKLNDEVIFITQNTKLVDPNFYRLAQEFHYCRNHRLRKVGRFRGDNKFTAHIYDGPANDNSQVTPNVETFALDLEVARCYDTSAGVGMPGGSTADAGARAKGVPLWTIWAAIGLAICGVYYVFNYILPSLSTKYLTAAVKGGTLNPDAKPSPKAQTRPDSAPGQSASPPSHAPAAAPTSEDAPKPQFAKLETIYTDAAPEKPLWVTGFVVHGQRVNVQLSDGRTLTERDVELSGSAVLERNALKLRTGERIFLMGRRPPTAPVTISPPADKTEPPAPLPKLDPEPVPTPEPKK